jgi:hypothetical protein
MIVAREIALECHRAEANPLCSGRRLFGSERSAGRMPRRRRRTSAGVFGVRALERHASRGISSLFAVTARRGDQANIAAAFAGFFGDPKRPNA